MAREPDYKKVPLAPDEAALSHAPMLQSGHTASLLRQAPLHQAASMDEVKQIREILGAAPDPMVELRRVAEFASGARGTALHAAIGMYRSQALAELLAWCGDNVVEILQIQSSDFPTALFFALQCGSVRGVEMICEVAPSAITAVEVEHALELEPDMAKPILEAMAMPVKGLITADGGKPIPQNFPISADVLVTPGMLTERGDACVEGHSAFLYENGIDDSGASVLCQISAIHPALKCSQDVLYKFSLSSDVNGSGVLGTLAARAVITAAWNRGHLPFLVALLMHLVWIAMLAWLSCALRSYKVIPMPPVIVLCAITLYETIFKILAFVTLARQHKGIRRVPIALRLYTVGRFLVMAMEIYVCEYLLTQRSRQTTTQDRLILTVLISLRWMNFAWHLRVTRYVGPRMLPILHAVGDILGFIIVLVFAMAAAVHSFYTLGTGTGGHGHAPKAYNDFMAIYRLAVLNDFDLSELEGEDSQLWIAVHLFFLCVSSSISIILMNILIGVLGNNYDRFEDRGEELFMRARASLLCLYLASPWKHCMKVSEMYEGKTIIVASRPENRPGDEDRSIRTCLDRSVNAIHSRLSVLEHGHKKMQKSLDAAVEDLRLLVENTVAKDKPPG